MSEIRLEVRGAFPHQQAFLDCPKRYAIACSGTKAGKSTGGAMYAIRALGAREEVRGTWVAPTYAQAVGIGFEAVLGLLPREHCGILRSGTPRITLPNGSSIDFKSADQPDNLFGATADFAILDEAGRCSEDAWHAVRTTLTATGGPMRLLSNPTPRIGWFYALYLRGLADDPDVASFRWRTADNPLIPAGEIEDAQRTYSESAFRSLYLGEFLDVGGSVFRNLRQAATGALKPPEPGRKYIAGVDLARTVDWTVMTVVDVASREVVEWARWHQTGWEMSVGRIFEIAKRYNGALVHVDSTGLGDVAIEMIERAGVCVRGYKFSNTSKAQIVEHLAALIEKGLVKFPPLDILMGELEAFEGTTGPTGTVKYGAAGSGHDDAVISLGLAVKDIPIGDPIEGRVEAVWPGGRRSTMGINGPLQHAPRQRLF